VLTFQQSVKLSASCITEVKVRIFCGNTDIGVLIGVGEIKYCYTVINIINLVTYENLFV
jgi:hypothetical protein